MAPSRQPTCRRGLVRVGAGVCLRVYHTGTDGGAGFVDAEHIEGMAQWEGLRPACVKEHKAGVCVCVCV